ncbi:hypothetical protein LAC1533_0232 [Ligilactobacillus acidipiscis]|uniref:Uncharacterized protein n=1 Tax=Ligilactobacillus acidipiscis TaxID=89059 RepID=A0A1K1KL85_9LACO|nr:hypothetical protein LAC1533_0232 [Ligilactobacillus acidipiscis]
MYHFFVKYCKQTYHFKAKKPAFMPAQYFIYISLNGSIDIYR